MLATSLTTQRDTASPPRFQAGVRLGTATSCTAAALVLMTIAGAAGLADPGIYQHETTWAAAALRGGDLASLAAVPVLLSAVAIARRGSLAGMALWAGLLAYDVYNYAYYVFGAKFNDLFLLHILILALSGWSLVFLLPALRARLRPTVEPVRATRASALFLGIVAAGLGGLWVYAIVRGVLTGEVGTGAAPVSGLHTVFAVDLTLLVSSLVVATVLGWQGTGYGVIATAVMSVAGTAYLVNLMLAAEFQASAGVDVAAFSPMTAGLTLLFFVSAVLSVIEVQRATAGRREVGAS